MKIVKVFAVILLFSTVSYSQKKCGYTDYFKEREIESEGFLSRKNHYESAIATQIILDQSASHKENAVITIPVVVHVVYRTAVENISDAQIISQFPVLNRDFRKRNADTLNSSSPFYNLVGDAEIEFCLAKYDPFGSPTTGITRTYTTTTAYNITSNVENVKNSGTGGKDNWDPSRYLNIWVCNLTGGVLGFSAFPWDLSTDPSLDGVVIGYKYFGTTGAVTSPIDLGRTLNHEIGHWLGLYHVWGDAACGNDFVSDTPPHVGENFNCPSFPHRPNNACGGGPDGELFMNFMDYVDDDCMNMFTKEQISRMRANINSLRNGIITQVACTSTAGFEDLPVNHRFSVSPNPAQSNEVELFFGPEIHQIQEEVTIEVTDMSGKKCIEVRKELGSKVMLTISDLASGSYIIKVQGADWHALSRINVFK